MTYSLNMFKSSFELAAKHSDKASFQAYWEDAATVAKLHRDAGDRPTFLLHDGPPYANGHLHLGHFVNKTLKDALLKYKRLAGDFAPFVPGFDCHGLPVELEVEKLGVSKTDPQTFAAACRAYALSQVALQTVEFKEFGVSADWGNAYRTLDPEFEAGAAAYFGQLPHKVQRLRPVHWCPHCASSLAEAEVEYKAKTSDSLEVLFPLLDGAGAHDGVTFLQVWTTTPYTLPANKAVGFHAGFNYVAVPQADGRLLVRLRQGADAADAATVDLSGRWATSPWTNETVPLLAADFVTGAGTGLVHLAPSFGLDDYRVCEAHVLPVEPYLDDRGRFLPVDQATAGAVELTGLTMAEGSAAVLTRLTERGLVHSQSKVEHEYPHCWRHKKPLFFKASTEWFLDLTDVGPAALAALDEVSFTPPAGRERLASMLRSRGSWCLSRNRLWGSPLATPGNPDEAAALESVRTQGVEAWQSNDASAAGHRRRTLDVWFDSGVTHALVMRTRFGRTADLYLEGSDQHRGWFQSSLLTAVSVTGKAPFKEVLTHGFVVDEHGRKYAKSSGNYLPLGELFKKYSPDVLRLWALSQGYTHDLKMSTASLDRTVERYRKFRNTFRFCLQNTTDFDFTPRGVPTHALHRHQLAEMARVRQETTAAAARHDFTAAVASLALFAETTSGDYFNALKDTLYCDAADAPARREAQGMLARMMDFLLRALMPVLPYTVEEVFQQVRERAGYKEACSLLLTFEGVDLGAVETALPALRELKAEMNRFVETGRDDFFKGAAQLELVVTSPVTLVESELVDYFGCAAVSVVQGDAFGVRFSRTEKLKCARCRRHHKTVLQDLCARCVAVEEVARVPEALAVS